MVGYSIDTVPPINVKRVSSKVEIKWTVDDDEEMRDDDVANAREALGQLKLDRLLRTPRSNGDPDRSPALGRTGKKTPGPRISSIETRYGTTKMARKIRKSTINRLSDPIMGHTSTLKAKRQVKGSVNQQPEDLNVTLGRMRQKPSKKTVDPLMNRRRPRKVISKKTAAVSKHSTSNSTVKSKIKGSTVRKSTTGRKKPVASTFITQVEEPNNSNTALDFYEQPQRIRSSMRPTASSVERTSVRRRKITTTRRKPSTSSSDTAGRRKIRTSRRSKTASSTTARRSSSTTTRKDSLPEIRRRVKKLQTAR